MLPIQAMDDVDQRAIETFGKWLRSLGDDTKALASVVADESVTREVRRPLAGALNYLLKSLDLIDDGIEGLGYMDDAFVLRMAASKASEAARLPESLSGLAGDAELIRDVLGDLAARLDRYVQSLEGGVVRGRSVDEIVDEPAVREELLGDVSSFSGRYTPPAFVMDEQAIVTLRAFLASKLP